MMKFDLAFFLLNRFLQIEKNVRSRKSLCCTRVNSEIVSSFPDITTCQSNGHVYEVKNQKVIGSFSINGEKGLIISCHYVPGNDRFILYYLILTATHKLLLVRKYCKSFEVVKVFEDVQKLEVYDFKCVGHPQIMIWTLNSEENLVEFPIEEKKKEIDINCTEFKIYSNSFSNAIEVEEQNAYKFVEVLTEEYESFRKICAFSENGNSKAVPVGLMRFSESFENIPEQQISLLAKWQKVFGGSLVIGMRICNTGKVTLDDMEVIISHDGIKEYSYKFFPPFDGIFSPVKVGSSLSPGEEIFVVGAFPMPRFVFESEVPVLCLLVGSRSERPLLKETFGVNVADVALAASRPPEEEFSGLDWMSLVTVETETRLSLEAQGMRDLAFEVAFKRLGFKRVNQVKDKLLYCTSKYLNRVFVALRQVAANPTVWELRLYTREDSQVYFFVNALYSLLPENAKITAE